MPDTASIPAPHYLLHIFFVTEKHWQRCDALDGQSSSGITLQTSCWAEYNKEVRLQDERIKLFIEPEDDLCLLSEQTATTLLLINNEVIIILTSWLSGQ